MLHNKYKKLYIGLLAISALTACGSDSTSDIPQPSPTPTPAPTPDTTPPVLTLIGDATIEHEAGTAYTDSGATASDNIDGTLTSNITVTGNVDSNTLGTYTLTYNVSDASGNNATALTRTVNVVDTRPPTITLLGMESQNVELGSSYTDSGATASDEVDGDLSTNIVVTGTVNVDALGTYELRYDVSDTSGNAAQTVIRTVIVEDTIAPSIISFAPEENASDVALDTPVSVTFSEAIANNSITTSAFTVADSDGNNIEGTIDLDAMGTSLSFQANSMFTQNTQYTVSLSTDINDIAGNPLAAAFMWQFTTLSSMANDPVFPELINIPSTPVGIPALAVNDTGFAVAAWRQGGELYVNRYLPEGGWQGVEVLSVNNSGSPREDVNLAINNNGDIFAVWINDDSREFTTTISGRRYTQANGWEDSVLIDNRARFSLQAQLAIDQQGNAAVIWTFAGNGNDDPGIYVSHYDSQTNQWDDSFALATYLNTSFNSPDIAMNATGEATAAWVVGGEQIVSASYNPLHLTEENGWTNVAAIGIDEQSVGANYPHVAINNAGEAIVVWNQQTSANSNGDIYTNYMVNNMWTNAIAIESLAEGEARYPQVAINEENAIIIWTEFDGATYNVYANILDETKQLSGAILLEESPYIAGNSNNGGARVAMNNSGMVSVAWEQDEFIDETMRTESRIFINQFDISTAPSASNAKALAQENALTEAYDPALGIDINGNAIVVSQRLASNSLDIQAHTVKKAQE